MDERILMEKIAGGDEAALHALLRQYGPLIRYIIAPIVPDAHDRGDCFSEVTLRIWEKADRFAPQRGSWKAWLTAVTRNTAYNFAWKCSRFLIRCCMFSFRWCASRTSWHLLRIR